MNVFEEEWKSLLFDVIEMGSDCKKDDSEIVEKLGNHVFIMNPYADTGYAHLMNKDKFADAVKEGIFDIDEYPLKSEALHDYVVSIEDVSKILLEDENSFVYTYPERLRNYFPHDFEYPSINQLDVIKRRLRQNKGSNRAVAVTLIPQWDCERVDIPCLQVLQALIRDDELVLSVFFRSNDLYGAWVSNMMFLTYIGLWLTDNLRKQYPTLVFGGIDYHSSSLHIYQTDLEQAKKVIQR